MSPSRCAHLPAQRSLPTLAKVWATMVGILTDPLGMSGDKIDETVLALLRHVTPGNERVHRTLPPASIEGVLP